VVKHDSFTVPLIPMLSENFTRISYLPCTEPNLITEQALAGVIRQENPDVFIEEIMERFLLKHPLDENIVFGGGE
jgi:hypothetical protein